MTGTSTASSTDMPTGTDGNIVVIAGAGTGKTHALVEHYAGIVLHTDDAVRVSPDRVLAVTFTEKAAAEMRARVLLCLADAKRTAHLKPPQIALIRRGVAFAPILTFHALCARLLRQHAARLALDPAFAILDAREEIRLVKEAAEASVLDALQQGDSNVAELVTRLGLRGTGERGMLVDGIVSLLASLAERGVAPEQMPLCEAARMPVDVAFAGVAGAIADARAAGGHARVEQAALAKAGLFAAMHGDPLDDDDDAPDPEAHMAHAFSRLKAAAAGNWGGNKLKAERQALVMHIEALGAALVDHLLTGLAGTVRELVAATHARITTQKNVMGVLGFGDLLLATRDLLKHHPSIRARIAQRFAYVLVDEYQDTSPVQEEIVYLLSEAPGSATAIAAGQPVVDAVVPQPGRTFVVGDPRQSIYGFRGANVVVLSNAVHKLAKNGVVRPLLQSRRSTGPLVAFANLIATETLSTGAFGVPSDQVKPLTSLRAATQPTAGAWWQAPTDGEHAAALAALTPHERECRVLAAGVVDLLHAGAALQDIVVLVRRGKAMVPIARALAQVGVPADVVGGDGFFARPEVADVICALTLAVDPSDALSMLAVLRSPLILATDDDILLLHEKRTNSKVALTLTEVERIATHEVLPRGLRERIQQFSATLLTARRHIFEGALWRAVDALVDGGYDIAMAVESDAALRAANIDKLRHMVMQTQGDAVVSITRLIELLDEAPPEALAKPSRRDAPHAVRIMTVHQSKGLEFPVVVVADAGSGLRGETDDIAFDVERGLAITARGRPIAACIPTGSQRQSHIAIQRVRQRLNERNQCELARVLYVALTRARDALYVVGNPRKKGPGSMLGLLEQVEATNTDAFQTLLPRVAVPFPPRVFVAERTQRESSTTQLPPDAPRREKEPAHGAITIARLRPTEAPPWLSQQAERTCKDACKIIAACLDAHVDALTSIDDAKALVARTARTLGMVVPEPMQTGLSVLLARHLLPASLQGAAVATAEHVATTVGERRVLGTVDVWWQDDAGPCIAMFAAEAADVARAEADAANLSQAMAVLAGSEPRLFIVSLHDGLVSVARAASRKERTRLLAACAKP